MDLWKNTRDALKDFTIALKCYKCGNKPTNAIRYINCDHFFCEQCVGSDSTCVICNAPVKPTEIHNDHLIRSLVSYCNIVAEVIEERDIWRTTADLNATELPIKTETSFAVNTKYNIPKKNINKQNGKGETKLHIACLKNQEGYVKALLAAGADPNTKDHSGWTPLQEVVSIGYTNICQLLLECGALPNTPGEKNRRPLHDAALNNRLPEAKMLLKYSASKNVYDDHGKKPIDYCKKDSEMWNILKDENELNNGTEEVADLNCTLNRSLSVTQSFNTFVIYASNLREENKKYLDQTVSKHKIKIVSVFRPFVTHVIVEANNENVVQLSYDVMMALLRGSWLLNTEWIQLGMDIDDILKGDLEVFEVSGAPIEGIPKKARENAQAQNPGLFNKCNFYFALPSKNPCYVNDVPLTKDALMALVSQGDGKVLKREPNPENVKNIQQLIPFHIVNQPSHPLYKCTHYVIYVPGRDEPRIKYNMPHMKTLPLMWLIECIEKFTLIDPSQIGLLKF